MQKKFLILKPAGFVSYGRTNDGTIEQPTTDFDYRDVSLATCR